jgi:hypothetical protein
MASMMLCPARVGQTDNKDYDATPTEALTFGSYVHTLIEQFGFGIEDPSPKTGRQLFEMEFNDDVKNMPYPPPSLDEVASDTLIARSVEEGLHALRLWREQVLPHLSPDGKAEGFMFAHVADLPDGTKVWLRGTPDYVEKTPDGVVTIDDWKTAATDWPKNKHLSEIQPFGYRELYQAVTGVLAHRFQWWIYSRKDQVWRPRSITFERTADQRDAFMAQLLVCARMIADNTFMYTPTSGFGNSPRGWWCTAKYCNAWNICPGKHLIADGRAFESRSLGWA